MAIPCQEKGRIDSLLGDAIACDKNDDGEALCDLVAQPAWAGHYGGCPLRLVNPLHDELPVHPHKYGVGILSVVKLPLTWRQINISSGPFIPRGT